MSSIYGRAVLLIAILLLGMALSACAVLPGGGFFASSQVTYQDTRWCLPRRLKRVLRDISHRFGPVIVTSTKRGWFENWRKGGARRSYHRRCKAADFNVKANPRAVVQFLRAHPDVGGYKYYPGGHYHIDTGPRRTW